MMAHHALVMGITELALTTTNQMRGSGNVTLATRSSASTNVQDVMVNQQNSQDAYFNVQKKRVVSSDCSVTLAVKIYLHDTGLSLDHGFLITYCQQ